MDISNYNNVSDYLSIFNAALITDLIVILLKNIGFIHSKVLIKWYAQYNLSAVIADVVIIVLGITLLRAIYYYLFDTFSLLKFISLAVVLQLIHDTLFYLFFMNVPRGSNRMLDTFKDYANEMSFKVLIADALMVISTILIASYLVNVDLNTNIIVLFLSLYVLPFILYN
jgi:hypothetical protein